MRVAGVIPAKASSSRVKSKNLQELLGVPLFLWAANNLSRVLDRADIYVDSDGDEIIDLARKHGFQTIRRPDSLATNATNGNEFMLWEAENIDADILVQHLPPMAFLKKSTLEKAIEFVQQGYDSAFAARKEAFYLWNDDGPAYDLHNLPNSFTLPKLTIEGMGLYVVRRKALLDNRLRISGKYAIVETDNYESIDIDYPEDLDFVRTIANGLPRDSPYICGISQYAKTTDIRLVILDVDGVMTDGGMYYTDSGEEFKKFSTRDGIAIKRLLRHGIEVAFLSSGVHDTLIQKRAKTLGVERIYVGAEEKHTILSKWIAELNLEPHHIAYLGDDINDLSAMKLAGLTACPSDAVDIIKRNVTTVLDSRGGQACVREFVNRFLVNDEEDLT